MEIQSSKSFNGKVLATRVNNRQELLVSIQQLQIPDGFNTKALETLYG